MGLWGMAAGEAMEWGGILHGKQLGGQGSIQWGELVGMAASCALEKTKPWREPCPGGNQAVVSASCRHRGREVRWKPAGS
jgi:hypothetical protein